MVMKPGFHHPLVFRSYAAAACPGCEDGEDLFGGGLSWGTAGNAGADQDAAQLGEHVFEGGLGLGAVPGLGGAAGGDVGRVVAVPGVPDDDQGVR